MLEEPLKNLIYILNRNLFQEGIEAPDYDKFLKENAEGFKYLRRLEAEYSLIQTPIMSEQPEYGDLMTLEDFVGDVFKNLNYPQ